MSDFTAIRSVSKSLRALLRQHITYSDDSEVGGVPISLATPKELDGGPEGGVLSLWLYQVSRNAEMLNRPPSRPSRDTEARKSLSLELHYLITPLADSSELEHVLLGRALQVLNDYTVLEGPMLLDGLDPDQALRVHLQPMSLEELTRVWDALKEPYQLSAAYLVQIVDIDPLRAPKRVPFVEDASARVGSI